jgi:hypothetical protein
MSLYRRPILDLSASVLERLSVFSVDGEVPVVSAPMQQAGSSHARRSIVSRSFPANSGQLVMFEDSSIASLSKKQLLKVLFLTNCSTLWHSAHCRLSSAPSYRCQQSLRSFRSFDPCASHAYRNYMPKSKTSALSKRSSVLKRACKRCSYTNSALNDRGLPA